MSERRLSTVNRKTYGIAVTSVTYLRHAFIDDAGPNGTAKKETEFYYFCDGKLYFPPRTISQATATPTPRPAQRRRR